MVGTTSWAAKKMTINVIPETAKIFIDGQLVNTGTYQVKFDKNTDFYVVKVEAPGYITRTYRLLKSDPKSTVLYTFLRMRQCLPPMVAMTVLTLLINGSM